MLTITYLALAGLGCLYIVVSAFLGHLGDFGDSGGHGHGDGGADGHAGGGHGDGGGHDAGHYGVDGGGVGKVSAGEMGGAFHFPFFSPLAVATLFTAIGAWGLISRHAMGVSDGASLLIALPAAFGTAYLVTWASYKLVSSSRGSSMIRADRFAGSSGEVLTPIPEGGLGEVAAVVDGHRYTSSAREIKGRALPRGRQVRIVKMSGSTLLVESEEG
jgi:membrane protein implicated in regulation of membrane protease activity